MPAASSVPCNVHIAKCFEILGQEPNDKFRLIWSRASRADRRLFLKLAYLPEYLHEKEWAELTADSRGQIKSRARDMRDWLNRTLG